MEPLHGKRFTLLQQNAVHGPILPNYRGFLRPHPEGVVQLWTQVQAAFGDE